MWIEQPNQILLLLPQIPQVLEHTPSMDSIFLLLIENPSVPQQISQNAACGISAHIALALSLSHCLLSYCFNQLIMLHAVFAPRYSMSKHTDPKDALRSHDPSHTKHMWNFFLVNSLQSDSWESSKRSNLWHVCDSTKCTSLAMPPRFP